MSADAARDEFLRSHDEDYRERKERDLERARQRVIGAKKTKDSLVTIYGHVSTIPKAMRDWVEREERKSKREFDIIAAEFEEEIPF